MKVTERFSDCAGDYDLYRPGYPASLGHWLASRGMGAKTVVADVGAGTGIFSQFLLALGCEVFLIEPNAAMIERARHRLRRHPRATLLVARAEAIPLGTATVDWVTAAQAFHWFDAAAAKEAFTRSLRPGGQVLLVWNDRCAETDDFMGEYESLLREFGADYAQTTCRMRVCEAPLSRFFAGRFERARFDNSQELDEAGLLGRLFSSSYMPRPADPRRLEAHAHALDLFARRQRSGRVTLRYDTIAYVGHF